MLAATQSVEHAYKNLREAYVALRAACDGYEANLRAQFAEHLAACYAAMPNLRYAQAAWDEAAWSEYRPGDHFLPISSARVGQFHELPVFLPVFGHAHVVIANGDGDDLLQNLALRLVLCSPPGRVRLHLADPVGGGNRVAALLPLPAALRSAQVATRSSEIEAALDELINHVRTVVQERLVNTHPNIEAYNATQPELAVPYHLLVWPDALHGITERAWDGLRFIAQNGARAGVYLLASLAGDARPPRKANLDDVLKHATVLRGRVGAATQGRPDSDPTRGQAGQAGEVEWTDPELGRLRAHSDGLPTADVLNRACDALKAAIEQANTRVPFARIAVPSSRRWQASSADGLRVAIGVDSRGELCEFALGSPNAHALIGGVTGFGKSRLLDVVITQLAQAYSPDELAFYLIDLKEGVAFQDYVRLPHARVVSLENEREFGLNILRRLQDEIRQRAEVFKSVGQGVDNLSDYRRLVEQPMPRIVLVMDEFQLMFAEEDAIAREAIRILEDLARRGRGFGIHLVLCSQSPRAAAASLDPVIAQTGLRIAFRSADRVSQQILGEGNDAAMTLEKPGEAIFNAAMGSRAANVRMRVALLEPAERARLLDELAQRAGGRYPAPLTFRSTGPADIGANAELRAALANPAKKANRRSAKLWLGQPLEISDDGAHTAATLQRADGSNLLVAGGDEAQAYALLMASALSLHAQFAPDALKIIIADFARPDSAVEGAWERFKAARGVDAAILTGRQAAALLPELQERAQQRMDGAAPGEPTITLIVCGLHRWRELRPTSDYGLSDAGKALVKLLEDGPATGIHVLAWCDGASNFERALKRGALVHFDLRAALRMSEGDSNFFIGGSAAAKLADARALLRDETWAAHELEKFKPYAIESLLE